MPRVLVVTRDVPLLRTRDLMLGTFFSVLTAGTVAEARNLIEEERFDLLVLCHSLTEQECRQLTKSAQLRRSTAKVLATSPHGKDVKPWEISRSEWIFGEGLRQHVWIADEEQSETGDLASVAL